MPSSLIFYDLSHAKRFIFGEMGKVGGKSKSKDKVKAASDNIKKYHRNKKIIDEHKSLMRKAYSVCNIFRSCKSKNCKNCEEYLKHAEE